MRQDRLSPGEVRSLPGKALTREGESSSRVDDTQERSKVAGACFPLGERTRGQG
jgi:hypothetical protein